ncbi:MAG: metallophosphoesterase family protein [bacterium]
MKIAIISDIHGNLEALSYVINEIIREDVDSIINLGDTVGYGADPDKCLDVLMFLCGIDIAVPSEIPKKVEKLKEKCLKRVAGNHDWGVISKIPKSWFNEMAVRALIWTESQLSERHRNFLDGLPLVEQYNGTFIVHSSPINPEEFNYVIRPEHAYASLKRTEEKVIFIGHSHIPGIFVLKDDKVTGGWEYEHILSDDEKILVNVGSIGQPRDSDPRASYAIYNTKERAIRIIRVEYDIEKAVDKIKSAGIPERYAERLKWGL